MYSSKTPRPRLASSPQVHRTRRFLQMEKLESRAVPAVFTVTSLTDSGPGSLRSALVDANQSDGLDTINFQLADNGVRTIALVAELPPVTGPVIVDGWSQPGATDAPLIELRAAASGIEYGLSVFAHNSVFRGLVMNGFSQASIALWGGDSNKVQGNYLGTNAAGTAAVGSTALAGVYVAAGATRNVIGVDGDGHSDAREANLVAASDQMGIWLHGPGTDGNRVAGNYVGTNLRGSAGLGNRWGVYVSGGAQNNLIGSNLDGVSDGYETNRITGNAKAGIAVTGAATSGTRIAHNLIYGNGGLAIDLGDDGATPNGASHADAGPAGRVNAPLIQAVSGAGPTFTTSVAVRGTARTNYRIEFVAANSADFAGRGAAERLLGSRNVTTNASGVANLLVPFGVPLEPGWVVSATATDGSGNTSEFSLAMEAGMSIRDTFALHSNPAATKRIYLDFNGHTTTGTHWNADYGRPAIVSPAFSLDGDAAWSDEELHRLQRIFRRVAEDFLPFDVDVTTQQPPLSDLVDAGAGDERWGLRVVIGGSSSSVLGTSVGAGIAYVGSFKWNSDTPAFIFASELDGGAEADVAATISHEVGHALGLHHDGTDTGGDYYPGHGSGPTSWGSLMGSPYGKAVTQWSRGDYLHAANREDDLEIITSQNGFGYRADTVGASIATAQPVPIATLTHLVGQVHATGIIERNTDRDVFSLDLAAGLVDLHVRPDTIDANLDILAELLDSSGNVIAASNPPDSLSARLRATVPAGRYYVRIDGVGTGDPLGSGLGYTDYGSLGYYRVSGRVPHTNVAPVMSGVAGVAAYREGDPSIVLAPQGTITDADSDNFANGTFLARVSANARAGDRMTVRHQGNAAGQIGVFGNQVRYGGTVIGTFRGGSGGTALTVALNSSATPAAVQALLRNVTFHTLGDAPAAIRRTIEFRLGDGDRGVSSRLARFVDITVANDAPQFNVGSALGYVLNAAPVALSPLATASDADHVHLGGGSLTVRIAAGADGSNRLAIRGPFVISGVQVLLHGVAMGRLNANAGVGLTDLVVSFTAEARLGRVQMLLRSLTFGTLGGTATMQRSVQWTLSDGAGGTAHAQKMVTVR
jgi:hypothetical protein